MHTSHSNDEDTKTQNGLWDATEDSTWGEGSASALQTLKNIEERRAKAKPSEERPSAD